MLVAILFSDFFVQVFPWFVACGVRGDVGAASFDGISMLRSRIYPGIRYLVVEVFWRILEVSAENHVVQVACK